MSKKVQQPNSISDDVNSKHSGGHLNKKLPNDKSLGAENGKKATLLTQVFSAIAWNG